VARRFAGNSVFITGASSGIGAALGRAFASEGARVALVARSQPALDAVRRSIAADGGEAIALVADVTDRASLDAAVGTTVEAFGGIDVAVANAGFGVNGVFSRLSISDFRRQFEVNLFCVIDTVYAVLPHLERSKGRLGLVSSVMGRVGFPASSAYCASKFAVCGLAECLYYDLGDRGVSVTCINPGIVESNIRRRDNQGIVHDEWKDPAPPFLIVPVDKAARAIIRALYRRQFEAVITGHGKAVVALARHFPRTVRTLTRLSARGRTEQIERAKRG
jgi:short-subunit dehydrogenase